MSKIAKERKHEVSFCADVKSWADALCAKHPEWPFGGVHIEERVPAGDRRDCGAGAFGLDEDVRDGLRVRHGVLPPERPPPNRTVTPPRWANRAW